MAHLINGRRKKLRCTRSLCRAAGRRHHRLCREANRFNILPGIWLTMREEQRRARRATEMSLRGVR